MGSDESPAHARLLIADDSAEMREMLRAAVGAEFGDIVELADGRELFWAMLHVAFADGAGGDVAVVTDLCMPTYDGLTVLDACKELELRIPTVLITAFPNRDVQQRAAAVGAVVLAKPFSTSTLKQTLREAIRARR